MILATKPEAPHIHRPFVVGVTLVDAGVALEIVGALASTYTTLPWAINFVKILWITVSNIDWAPFHSPGSQDQFPFLTWVASSLCNIRLSEMESAEKPITLFRSGGRETFYDGAYVQRRACFFRKMTTASKYYLNSFALLFSLAGGKTMRGLRFMVWISKRSYCAFPVGSLALKDSNRCL